MVGNRLPEDKWSSLMLPYSSPFGGRGVWLWNGHPGGKLTQLLCEAVWRAVRFTMTLSFISVPPCLQTSWSLEQDRDICPNVQIQHIHGGWAHTCLAGEGRHAPCLRNQAEANGQMNQRCWGWKTGWEAESRGTSGHRCCTCLFRSPGLEMSGGAFAQTCSLPVITLHFSYWP